MKTNLNSVLWVIIIATITTSCSSFKKNFIDSDERNLINLKAAALQVSRLDSARAEVDKRMDSLIQSMSIKHGTPHLAANQINLLFSIFEEQLAYDKVFNGVLQKNMTKKGALVPLQYQAASHLLRSAATYERLFQDKRKLRRTLNRGDASHHIRRNVLQKSRNFLYSPAIRRKIKSGMNVALADSLLSQLPPTNVFKSTGVRLYRKNDRVINFFYGIFTFTGKTIFGTGTKTTIKALQRKNAAKLQPLIRPFDILLSRNSTNMSTKVIPGYFGHAATWLGSKLTHKNKLGRLLRKENKAPLSVNEKGIVEALRSGVQQNNLKHFADGEVFLVLRLDTISPEQQTAVADNVMKQLNKSYDFNFDIESPDAINCTELIYLGYDFIPWKVSSYLGRYTIFPDDIVKTALENKRFKLVALLKNGEVMLSPNQSLITELMQTQ